MKNIRLGYAMCGSFCTFKESLDLLEKLVTMGADITPIMSMNAYTTDTRFGKAADHVARIEQLCGKQIIHTIAGAEPIGPKKLLDILVIAPCTGNTLAKLAHSIADTSVTMATKSHLRNGRPVLIAVSTNDALAGAAENIGKLLSRKNYYFVPFKQDEPYGKPTSIVADFQQIPDAIDAALSGSQLQPILL